MNRTLGPESIDCFLAFPGDCWVVLFFSIACYSSSTEQEDHGNNDNGPIHITPTW
jgi:hypothetical protein